MAEYMQLHGINWILTGNSDWDDPDVQVKMATARNQMDLCISAQSHADYDQDPIYGHQQQESVFDSTPGYDDLKILAAGDLEGQGFRWEYVLGKKYVQVNHVILGRPHVGQVTSAVPSWQLLPAIIAFAKENGGYREIGFITTGIETIEGPYQLEIVDITSARWISDPLLPGGFGQWSRYTPRPVPLDDEGNPDYNPGLKFVMQGKIVPGRGDMAEPELVQSWYEVAPSHDEMTSELVNWEQISPIYEEIVPIGTNQFEWGWWTSDTYMHQFDDGYCHESGEPKSRKIHLRDASWYGGWTYLDTICYPSDVRPDWGAEYGFGHIPILAVDDTWEGIKGILTGTHIEIVDYTFALWPYCEGEWPWSPAQRGQPDYMWWGYVNYQMWGSQTVMWVLPAVPEDEPWPENFPGKYWWDLVPPPQGSRYSAGIWYELDPGGWLGEPYIWAVRFGGQVKAYGGHYYDHDYRDHYMYQSTLVKENPELGRPEGHAFYWCRVKWWRESMWSRQFTGNADGTGCDWPFGYTSLFDICPCLCEWDQCGPWWDTLCESSLEWWEVYDPPKVENRFLIQFDSVQYEIEDAYNEEVGGQYGSFLQAFPRYYFWPDNENAIMTGGWGIGPGDGGYMYYSLILDGEHEYMRIPRNGEYWVEFPDITYEGGPVYTMGFTRLMYRYQEVREILGPLHEVWAAWGRDKAIGETTPA